MGLNVALADGQGKGPLAGVTPVGELLVAGIGTLTNRSMFQSMTVTGAGYNFFGPIPGQQFEITSIVITTTTTTTVTIFEAPAANSATIDKTLFQILLTASAQSPVIFTFPLPFGGFLPVSEGEYLNALTVNATANLNIIGYYHF